MSEKLTNLQQLRSASLEAKGLIAQVASAAAEAIQEVENALPVALSNEEIDAILVASAAAEAVEALDSSKQGQLQRITDEEIDAMWA